MRRPTSVCTASQRGIPTISIECTTWRAETDRPARPAAVDTATSEPRVRSETARIARMRALGERRGPVAACGGAGAPEYPYPDRLRHRECARGRFRSAARFILA